MKEFMFQLPSRVHVGFSKTKELSSILKQMNVSTALLVVDAGLSDAPLFQEIKGNLASAGITFDIFDDIRGEPTIEEVDGLRSRFGLLSRFDGVVGIGGGSAIDTAKVLAASTHFTQTIRQHMGTGHLSGKGLPNVMIPTTSGTGAEITPNAILRDEQEECKASMVSPFLIPDAVILDPQITRTLPPKATAETGIDAFTHCIECFIGHQSNPMSDLFAMEGMKLILASLRAAVRDGSDPKARFDMALGSLYGGIAITNSGTGAVHALAYPLGGKYKVTHGLSNAVLLAEVMDFNAVAVPDKFLRIADSAMSLPAGLTPDERVQAVLGEIRDLVREVEIERPKIGLSSGTLDFLASSAMTYQRLLVNNPRTMTINDAREIYRKALG